PPTPLNRRDRNASANRLQHRAEDRTCQLPTARARRRSMIGSNNRPLSDAQSPHGVARGIWLVHVQDIKVAITNAFFYAASNLQSDRKPRDRPVIRNREDRKSTRLNSSHVSISYAVFCL